MKKLAVLSLFAALALVVSAQAKGPHGPHYAPTPPTPPPTSHRCMTHSVGYNASGTLVSSTLTEEANGRYSGMLVVDVTRANHRAPTGEQTFTLSGARVKFHGGVSPTAPPAGSRVKLHGKITKLANKHCSTTGFTPTITIKKVDIRPAAPPKS